MSDNNSEMKAAADYAIRSAKEKFGQELDYSDQSIDKVENLLQQVYQSLLDLPSDEHTSKAISRTANIWGSYLGEFMRLKWGGSWILKDSERFVSIKNIEFSPIKFVYEKITYRPLYSAKKYLMEVESRINPSPVMPIQSQTEVVMTINCPYCNNNHVYQRLETQSSFGSAIGIGSIITIILLIIIAAYRVAIRAGALGNYTPDIFGDGNVGMFALLALIGIIATTFSYFANKKTTMLYECMDCGKKW